MQTIHKHHQPISLSEWRNQYCRHMEIAGGECNYTKLRTFRIEMKDIEDSLLAEQGHICAYTGRRISIENPEDQNSRNVKFHIEHLKPQKRCFRGEDVEYRNLVACWPAPNQSYEPEFGARKKGDWPGPEEERLFLSPLEPSCSRRFLFKKNGKIEPADQNDVAAKMTIKKLGLDNKTLTAYRKNQLEGMLHPRGKNKGQITKRDAEEQYQKLERELKELHEGGSVRLAEYCFAKMQVLQKHISSFR